ncbi:MAG: copper amine oxidase N-terminal domain-containing protein, partial [Clostridiales bacterium]|nr:copper amine oxidase N-terminal domain-containing protein [Clostridiales bacterium]
MLKRKRTARAALAAVTAAVITAVITAVTPFAAGVPSVEAAESESPIGIVVDGLTLSVDVAPVIVSDRVLVPFRFIGEALGASVEWDADARKVSMTLKDRFLDIVIGNTQMNIGRTGLDGNAITSAYTLDAPATIMQDRTMVPIRAVSEGLGSTVEWNPNSRTVIVTSPVQTAPAPTQPPAAAPTPAATPTPALNPVFAADSYFEIIDGSNAQFRYDNNNETVFFYFNSQDTAAAGRITAIRQAASRVGTKVLGIDTNSSTRMDRLSWLWRYVSQASSAPTLLFFYNQAQ